MFRTINATLISRFVAVSVCLATLLAPANRLEAVNYTWNVGSGNWNSSGNWTPGGGPPTTGDNGAINSGSATINAALVGTPNITIDGSGTTVFWNPMAGPATGGTITIQNSALLYFNGTGSTTNPTAVTLNSGARLGRLDSFDQFTTRDSITIGSGQTAYVNAIKSYVPIESAYRLELAGSLSGGSTSKLVVKPNTYVGDSFNPSYGQGMFRLAPTSANNGFTGTVEVEGLASNYHGILSLGGTGALAGTGATLSLLNYASLHFAGPTDPFGTGATTITVGGTDRLWWESPTGSTYTGATPTLSLQNGAALGKYYPFDRDTIKENLSIATGATMNVNGIRSYVPIESAYRLELTGTLSGDATTKVLVKPSVYTGDSFNPSYGQGMFRLGTSASGFLGTVEVEGLSATNHGILGLAGTGALSNATLVLKDYASLHFGVATNPFGAAAATITVKGTDRVWWETPTGTTYTNTATLSLQNGAALGKYYPFDKDTIKENIAILSGATAKVDAIRSYVPGEVAYGLVLAGALTGDATTKLHAQPNFYTGSFYGQGVLRLVPTAVGGNTGFLGKVIASGTANTDGTRGLVELGAIGAIGSGKLEVQAFGQAAVTFPGALDNATSATVLNNGILRFRNAGASTLANTTLAGTGLVRSESNTSTVLTTSTALQALNLSNVVLSPGTSAGTLTIEATTLSLDAASRLVIELGGLGQDLLQVNGNLSLNNATLQLETLDDMLGNGSYVIATYTGSLTGVFGTIENNMTGRFLVESIDYGILTPNAITLQLVQVPEPTTFALLGMGMVGLAVKNRRRRLIAA